MAALAESPELRAHYGTSGRCVIGLLRVRLCWRVSAIGNCRVFDDCPFGVFEIRHFVHRPATLARFPHHDHFEGTDPLQKITQAAESLGEGDSDCILTGSQPELWKTADQPIAPGRSTEGPL